MGWLSAFPIVGDIADFAISNWKENRQENTQWAAMRDQQEFQREMSNTSYQRAVGDMKAAGLNPMLAYSQGGASTPGGSVVGGVAGVPSHFGASAAQAAQVENVEAATAKTEAETRAIEATVEATKAAARRDNASASQIERSVDSIVRELSGRADVADYEGAKARWKSAGSEAGDEAAAEVDSKVSAAKIQSGEAAYKAKQLEQVLKRAVAEALLAEYGLPRAKNEARIEESFYGRHVRPYLRDMQGWVGSMSSTAAASAGLLEELATAGDRGKADKFRPKGGLGFKLPEWMKGHEDEFYF